MGLKAELCLFKTKDSKPKRVTTMCGVGKKQLEETIIKSIRNLFKPKEKKTKQIKIE